MKDVIKKDSESKSLIGKEDILIAAGKRGRTN